MVEKAVPLDLLMDQTFGGSPWHGPNLRTALTGVRHDEAAWSPAPGRPSIWRIVLHCAYWKHRIWQRVTGQRVPFPREGDDWRFPLPQPTAEAWNADRQLLHEAHGRLADAVAALSQSELESPGPGQVRTRMLNVVGIALHDTYHAGQIRVLRKLYPGASGGRSSPSAKGRSLIDGRRFRKTAS
jgi:uncharacterized damage-inducible protein DinB